MGVAFGLTGAQKLEDGEPLGSSANTAADFGFAGADVDPLTGEVIRQTA
jgi:hypothetical protein